PFQGQAGCWGGERRLSPFATARIGTPPSPPPGRADDLLLWRRRVRDASWAHHRPRLPREAGARGGRMLIAPPPVPSARDLHQPASGRPALRGIGLEEAPAAPRARFAEPAPQDWAGGRGLPAHERHEAANGHVRENGWQTKHASVGDRIGSLFNCQTMSDIIFHVEGVQIPAHRCVLGVTSPVFYHRLFETPVKDDGGRCRIWKISQFHGAAGRANTSPSPDHSSKTKSPEERQEFHIYQSSESDEHSGPKEPEAVWPPEATHLKPLEVAVDYPFDAFFEFMRYVYKDELNITLENVMALSFLADDFNLPSLSEKCLDFLRNAVRPDTALRILRVLKNLLCKAVVVLWRDTVESSRILARFKEFGLADRKKRMQELADMAGSGNASVINSRVTSRVGSRLGSRAGSRMGSRPDSRRSSAVSDAAYDAKTEDDMASAVGDMFMHQLQGKSTADIFKLAEGGKTIHPCVASTSLCKQFVEVGDLLNKKSWKCIRERTDVVLASPEFIQEERTVVKQILSMEMCSVSEIAMFRALLAWADHRCKQQGLPSLPEHRRNAAGSDFIELIRFPVMKAEEFQWEVVPSGILEYRDIQSIQRTRLGAFVNYSDEPRDSPPQEIARRQESAREAKRISCRAASPDGGLRQPGSPDLSKTASKESTASRGGNRCSSSKLVAFGDGLDADLPDRRVSMQIPSMEIRGWRAADMYLDRRSSSGGLKAHGPKAKASAQASPSYARPGHLRDDDLDALISARLWRNHVDELVSQQRALEALDGLDGDPDKRMAFCAEPPSTGERPWSPPLPRGGAERRGSGEAGAGDLLPPASPTPRPGSAARAKRRLKQEPTMALQTPRQGHPGGPEALQAPPKKVGLDELEHLAHGFYRFRGGSLIEMRLESGDPVVYEHRPPSSSSLGRTPTPEVVELLSGMRESQVRSSLGIRPPSTGAGVPLSDFLSGNI
ncbi:unnamed protein product, partial [Prorocentrum cordatum]